MKGQDSFRYTFVVTFLNVTLHLVPKNVSISDKCWRKMHHKNPKTVPSAGQALVYLKLKTLLCI